VLRLGGLEDGAAGGGEGLLRVFSGVGTGVELRALAVAHELRGAVVDVEVSRVGGQREMAQARSNAGEDNEQQGEMGALQGAWTLVI
jgi:hypothetical protein